MYFTKTKFAHSTLATLVVALSLSTTAFAGSSEATLTNNERAAQDAIASSPTFGSHSPSDSVDASLATNERAAQRAITHGWVDSEFANLNIGPVSLATSEATLIHNELSAQHAIVDAQGADSSSDTRRSTAALTSSPSNPSAAPR